MHKKIIFSIFTVFYFAIAFSQKNDDKVHQLGVFGEIINMNTVIENNTRVIGIMYKYSKKDNYFKRLHIGYINEESVNNPFFFQIISDTKSQHRLLKKEKGFYIGGGYEMQRNFYKQIFFYASTDMRLGYTQGKFAERIELIKNHTNTNNYISINDYDIPTFNAYSLRLEILPNVGIKLNLKRVNIALEAGISLRNTYISEMTTVKNNLYTFDIYGMRNRLIFMYK